MKKLMVVLAASLFTTAAYAQVAAQPAPGQPPAEAPAGAPGKLTKSAGGLPPKAESAASTDPKPTTRTERRAARKAQRAAKVGDKPIN